MICLVMIMNRPKEEDYEYIDYGNAYHFKVDDYVKDLNKYCDSLEKALDKACKQIMNSCDCCPYEYEEYQKYDAELYGCECTGDIVKCWKEWALKDENLFS